jgi:hypothetical protein
LKPELLLLNNKNIFTSPVTASVFGDLSDSFASTKLLKFEHMQVQVEIGFDQLLKIMKKLPSGQLKQLKAEIEKDSKTDKSIDLEMLLLNGPSATKKQLEAIAKNRKAINQWRTK